MSSPNVNTNINTRVPGIYISENTSNAITGLVPVLDKVCIIAQKTASGIATDGTAVQILSVADAILQCGAGSIGHIAVQAAINANPNITSGLSVLPLTDASGSVDATGLMGFTTATAAGQVNTWIGDYNIQYNYSSGDTSVAIAAGVGQAIKNQTGNIPIVCDTSAAASVHLVAVNAGTIGNSIAISCTASGGTGVIPTVTPMAGGSGDPTIGPYTSAGKALANIAGAGYTIIASTFSDSTRLAHIKGLIDFVSGPQEEKPCTAYYAYTDLIGSVAAAEALALTLNDGRIVGAYQSYSTGQLAKTPAFAIASAYAAIIASQTDPAAPYDGYDLPGVATQAVPDRMTQSALEALLENGVAPLKVAPGEIETICRAITTYTVNSLGYPDPTLLDITTFRSLDYTRFQIISRLSNMLKGAKNSARMRKNIKAAILNVLYELEALEIVQNVNQYKNSIIVESDLTNLGQVNVSIPANIVYGLHTVVGFINLILS